MADIILTEEDSKRFWSKTQWNPGTGCLEWRASTVSAGYGCFRVKKKTLLAHRVAVALCGVSPTGFFVCHRCDNPACVNTDHLFVGSHSDNMKDMMAKKRGKSHTHNACHRGHPFSPGNTIQKASGRECRACKNLHAADRRARMGPVLAERKRLARGAKKAATGLLSRA